MALTRSDYEVKFDEEGYDFPQDIVLFAKRALVYASDEGYVGPYLHNLQNDKTISFRIRAVLTEIVNAPSDEDGYISDLTFMKMFAEAPFVVNMCEALFLRETRTISAIATLKAVLNIAAFEQANSQF